MKLYFIETDEFSFLKSFEHEQFFSKHPFSELAVHDILVFLVNKKIAGVSTLASHDLKLIFSHVFEAENRLSFVGEIHHLLQEEWKGEIEKNIASFLPVGSKTAQKFLTMMEDIPSSYGYFLTNLEFLIEEAEREKSILAKKRQKESVEHKLNSIVAKKTETHTTEHSKAQFYLKEIARITECDVWTASNDKNRTYNGERLGIDDLENFPNFEMDEESKKRISLIDTIWFKGNYPVSCFEVETSTSVYSGLLRMSDFLSVMPNKACKIYIVAPSARKEKVMREMNRPVFKMIGLHKMARFVSIESLELLYQKIKGLDGYVNPHVIETIALDVKELEHLTS